MNSRRPAPWLGALAAAASIGLASCGGGGDQVQTFSASRVVALGDETSLIVDTRGDNNGSKYSVNQTVSDTDARLDCKQNPLWIQRVASDYGLVFPQCNPAPNAVSNPRSRIRATLGARAADLAAQIGAQIADGDFRDGDLATVLVGANDVLAQYAQYPAVSEIELTANVEAAGMEVARQVNRLAGLDVRVLVATIPDVSFSPYARTEALAHTDTDRAALIARLVERFNASLRASITNDGRRIGLVFLDEFTQTAAKFPGFNGVVNSIVGVCDLSKSQLVPRSILDCTQLTLIPNGTATGYLWADDRHLGAGPQIVLGNLAVQRANNNPF